MPERDVGRGAGRLLVAVYAVFALSSSSRAVLQLLTRVSDAPVAYVLSAVAAGAWFVSSDCWQALAVEGTSTNNVGELVAIRALLEAVPADRPLHVVYDSTYAQRCVTTWVHAWSRGGRVPPERWVTKEGTPVKNAELVARIADLLAGRTVTWSKVKSHTTLMTSEHVLNREADARAGAVVEALLTGGPWDAGPGYRVERSLSSPSTGSTSGMKP